MAESVAAVVANLADQLIELRKLASEGNQVAEAAIQWFDDDSDTSTSMGTYPQDNVDARHLAAVVGNTAHLFFQARAMKYLVENGQFPSHYSVHIGLEFGQLDTTNT